MSQHAISINDTTIQLPASHLKPGMFVCRLDRPWLGTPFIMQGFLVQRETEVQSIRELCQHVYIDTQKSIIKLNGRKTVRRFFTRRQIDEDLKVAPSIDRDLARTGIKNALPAYSSTIKALRECYNAYATDHLVNAKALEKKVSQCFHAILHDTTAISWLSRVKSHNRYSSEHSMHMSLLAMVFAVHCGWSKEQAQQAGMAGLLANIGKIKLSKSILNKPGPLSELEWQKVHEHPKWNRYFLEKSGFHPTIVQAAYHLHERPDGKGYPTKRIGGQIPHLARLLHILDAYDAMISYRPYAQQRTVFEATKILYRGRGTEFDETLVDQFIEMIGLYPVGTIVELTSGEIAVIIGQNNDAQLLPKIAIVRDRNKKPVAEKTANLRDFVDENGTPTVRIKCMLHDGSYGVSMRDYTRNLLVS